MKAWKILLAAWTAVLLIVVAAPVVLGAVAYEEPDFEKVLFDLDSISLEGKPRADLVDALAAVACNFGDAPRVTGDVMEKALALALRLDNMHGPARGANDALITEMAPAPLEGFTSPRSVAEFLWETARDLVTRATEPEDLRLAPYLIDIALDLDVSNQSEQEALLFDLLKREGISLEWRKVITSKRAVRAPPVEAEPDPVKTAGNPGPGQPGMEEPGPADPAGMTPPGSGDGTPRMGEGGPRKGRRDGRPGPGGPEKPPAGPVAEMKLEESSTYVVLPGDESDPLRFWRSEPAFAGKLSAKLHHLLKAGDGAAQSQVFSPGEISNEAAAAIGAAGAALMTKHGKLSEEQRLEFVLTRLGSDEVEEIDRVEVAAGCYALADAMALGADLDATFGICGNVEPGTGALTGAGHIGDIVALAAESGIKGLVVPPEVEEQLADELIGGNIEPLLHVQLFAAPRADDALRYLARSRTPGIDQAIALFLEIEKLLSKWTAEDLVRNAAVKDRLGQILDLCPEHLSARVLLEFGSGRLSRKLTLRGSQFLLERVALPPLRMAALGESQPAAPSFTGSSMASVSRDALFRIRDVRPMLHEDAMGYCNALTDFLEAVESFMSLENRTTNIAQQRQREMEATSEVMNQQRQRLLEIVAVRKGG